MVAPSFALPITIHPESTPDPADAGCNSQLTQYSKTPSLRVAGFEDEDDDEDENDAPGEALRRRWFPIGTKVTKRCLVAKTDL